MQTGTGDDVQLRTNSQLIRSNRDSLDRKDSIMTDPGREGQELEVGSGVGRAIGVFTSGGDSQGMSFKNKITIGHTNDFAIKFYIHYHYVEFPTDKLYIWSNVIMAISGVFIDLLW